MQHIKGENQYQITVCNLQKYCSVCKISQKAGGLWIVLCMTKRKHKSGMEKISQIKYEEFKKAKKNSSKKNTSVKVSIYICFSVLRNFFLPSFKTDKRSGQNF